MPSITRVRVPINPLREYTSKHLLVPKQGYLVKLHRSYTDPLLYQRHYMSRALRQAAHTQCRAWGSSKLPVITTNFGQHVAATKWELLEA